MVTGLTAAALAADAALSALLRSAHGSAVAVVAGVAYPVADLLLLVLVAGALAVIGRGAGPVLWSLTAGLAVFAVTDTGWAAEVVAGTYRSGGLLDIGWGLGFTCFARLPARRSRPPPPTSAPAAAPLVVPGCCAVVALALLLHGYLDTGEPLAGFLAVGAVAAALARTAVSFRSVRALADTRRLASTDELTGLANRRALLRAARGADAAGGAGEPVARAAPRPRPVQGDQRLPRPRRR